MAGAVGDLVADDGAEFGVGVFLAVAVAAAAVVKIRAVADIALVLVGPADEAVITVFRFHEVRTKCLGLVWQSFRSTGE